MALVLYINVVAVINSSITTKKLFVPQRFDFHRKSSSGECSCFTMWRLLQWFVVELTGLKVCMV